MGCKEKRANGECVLKKNLAFFFFLSTPSGFPNSLSCFTQSYTLPLVKGVL